MNPKTAGNALESVFPAFSVMKRTDFRTHCVLENQKKGLYFKSKACYNL